MSGGCKDLTRPTPITYILRLPKRLPEGFFPETVLKQDTLLLYNPKECRKKKVCSFLLLENPRPVCPWGPPRLLINLPRNWLSQSQQIPSSNHTREDITHGHHQMVNTKIRLIILFAAKDGEALYSRQKQDLELTVVQIMSFLLQNLGIN